MTGAEDALPPPRASPPRRRHDPGARFEPEGLLKRDLFGRIERGTLVDADGGRRAAVRRCVGAAPLATRPLARWLARREARALRALADVPDVPRLLAHDRSALLRGWLGGRAMQDARPTDPAYFRAARRLLVALHRRGVTHDDLAKEPNWLVRDDGRPALVDFQLARVAPRRGRLFRLLAREDLRHLLKHKRTYCPQALTPRERALLASPSAPARWLRRTLKPLYTLVTRRLLRWRDREGRGPRESSERSDRA